MVGIAQDNMGVHLLKLFRTHGFDGSQCPYRHEGWCVDNAVGSMDSAQPRTGLLAGLDKFIGYSSHFALPLCY
ncbi:hypothetical protein D3C73_1440030 [compost metagenome]